MATEREEGLRLSVVIPAYNAAATLPRCLDALIADAPPGTEIIVVDDHSTDATAELALRPGVRVIRLARNAGPSAARNAGAIAGTGDLLLFVDADVVVAANTIARVRSYLAAHRGCTALFGSYDAKPEAHGVVSRYRNLLHHFVHQRASARPSHFWSGLGAIRRCAFVAVGGFDESMLGIQDVELGYRLRRAGYEIHLDPTLQATHLKRWTLWSMVRTDIVLRALPWTRLLLRSRSLPRDLSLCWRARVSVATVWLLLAAIILTPMNPWSIAAAGVLAAAFLAINADLMRFMARHQGWRFMPAITSLHLFYCIYCGAGLLFGIVSYALSPGASKPGGSIAGVHPAS